MIYSESGTSELTENSAAGVSPFKREEKEKIDKR